MTPPPFDENDARSSWSEYARLVLSELQRNSKQAELLNEKVEQLRAGDLAQIKAEIMLLKFQAAMWGGLGGVFITGLVTLGIKLIK